VRGTWCPFCRGQLAALAKAYPALQSARIQPVAIACQSRRTLQRYLESNPLPFPFLPDEDRSLAKTWGTHYFLSWDGINLSRPALFIIGADSRILFAHVGRHMKDLPVELLLAQFLRFLRVEESGDGEHT
jgi:peroxiredoxin